MNFYSDYIAGSTRLTARLYALTAGPKGTEKVVLDAEELVAFNCLKQAFVTHPQLAHPDLSKQFIVHTDASKIAIGAVFLQRSEEGVERPISLSKKLSAPQQNYSTFERKCLTVEPLLSTSEYIFSGALLSSAPTTKSPCGSSRRSLKAARGSADE